MSVVIAALIVTALFLAIFAGLITSQMQLHQAQMEAIKREAEKAMEIPFQIYWLNDTHVRLFNNHSSIPITLRYWITSGPSSFSVFNLDHDDYSVGPGTFKDVLAADYPRNSSNVYKVVSERGNVFVVGIVGEASPAASLFKLLVDRKQVRPGFDSSVNGPLTNILLTTGHGFNGGQVSLTCVSSFPQTTLCSGWSISFDPPSPVNIPPDGAVVVKVNAEIPETTQIGNYFIRIRAVGGDVVEEFVLNVVVGDFSLSVSAGTITIRRGCAGTQQVTIQPNNYQGEIYFRAVSLDPQFAQRVHFALSPNPLNVFSGLTTSSLLIYVNNYVGPPSDETTVSIEARDGLGPAKYAYFELRTLRFRDGC